MIKKAGFLGVAILLVACANNASKNTNTSIERIVEMKGTVEIIENDGAKIHSYISPADGGLVTTQIIETAGKLVIVDVQFLRPYAKEVREYIDSLGKPVDRVIVTHSHPDHWFGLEYFDDLSIYSLEETKAEISKLGDMIIDSKKPVLGDLVTDKKVVPNLVQKTGSEEIDGLTYIFEKVLDAEAGVQLLIKMPSLKIVIAQDLVYNQVHLFIGQNALDGWLKQVGKLKKLSNSYSTILVGHGEPTTFGVLEKMEEYLVEAQNALETTSTPEELKGALVTKFPNERFDMIIDISSDFLFPTENSN